MGNLKISHRLALGFAVIVLLLVAAVSSTLWQVSGIKEGTDRIVNLRTPTAQASAGMTRDIYASLAALRGWMLTGRSEITGLASGSDLEMSFGYGGAVADVLLHGSAQSRISLRTLFGAGHARVLVPVVGPELNADNFGVFEP